jgi:hypothetical protein
LTSGAEAAKCSRVDRAPVRPVRGVRGALDRVARQRWRRLHVKEEAEDIVLPVPDKLSAVYLVPSRLSWPEPRNGSSARCLRPSRDRGARRWRRCCGWGR